MKLSIVLSVQPSTFEAAPFRGDLEKDLADIAALGYDGVELAIRDPSRVDHERLLAMVERCGLGVPAIGTGQASSQERLSLIHPKAAVRRAAIERVKAHIPLARRTGALIVIGLICGRMTQRQSRDKAEALLVDALAECARTAVEHSVRLVLEPLNRYETSLVNTVDQALELLERLPADSVGLLIDTFHMNIEEPSIEASIRRAASRILHVHVADSNRHAPGDGHLDFPSIVACLREVGYQGYLSGEFMAVPDARTAASRSISFLRSLEGAPHG